MSTEPSIQEINEAIAKFEGWDIVTVEYSGEPEETEWQKRYSEWMDKVGIESVGRYLVKVEEDRWHGYEDMPYHTDYNWLMSAWVKFRDLDMYRNKNVPDLLNYQSLKGALERSILSEPIAEAHKALYDAICWYNTLNTKP